MTPRQINVLAAQHLKANRTDGKTETHSEQGTAADLIQLARTPAR